MKIFVTGASGYIGGAVAARLVATGHRVTGLVRSQAKAEALRARGIEPVVGSLEDTAVLAQAAQAADATVNAANSDHAAAADTLIAALAGSGKVLLHTSGTSIVAKDSRGEPSDEIFTEDTTFAPVKEKAPRVAIDRRIRDAAGRDVRSVVLCNSLIYGYGDGIHRESVQIPLLAEEARRAGAGRHIGRGLNIWSNVHVADVAELYLLALERAPAGSFYFVENGEASFRDVAQAIAARLKLKPAEPWDYDDAVARLGFSRAALSLASNSRVCADRARRELGWIPKHGSVLDWIRTEMAIS